MISGGCPVDQGKADMSHAKVDWGLPVANICSPGEGEWLKCVWLQRKEWDDWVAEGKKSPYLGPYVPNNPEVP